MGIAVQFTLASGEITTAGGELSSEYKLHHFNFHWGSSNNVGSEHTVAGRHYPLEVSNCWAYLYIVAGGVDQIGEGGRGD